MHVYKDLINPSCCHSSCKDWQCGDVYPALKTDTRPPSVLELEQGLQDFSHYLAKRSWRFGTCDDHVVIVYNQEFQQVGKNTSFKSE